MSDDVQPIEPGFHRNMLLVSMLFVAVMAAMDLTIVSVALPYMAGSLNATPDEVTWVVTLFTIGQALVIGIVGHLSRLLGRKRLAIIAVVGFVLSSAACGLSQDLDTIVAFRFIQGLFSGPLIPISQSVLVDAYPAEQRTRVLAMWAMGVTAGPAIGPALGGLITQSLDWRWNFWVNFPIGVIALLLVLTFLRQTQPQNVKTDWLGFSLLAIFLICLQIGLDQGDRLDWFSSHEIAFLFIAAFTAFVAFTVRGVLMGEHNIINLRLLADTNFAACSLLMGLTGVSFLAFLVLAPALYVNLFGWEIVTAGYAVGISAAALMVASVLANPYMKLVGKHAAVITGSILTASGWYLFSHVNMNVSPAEVIVPGALICTGLMFTFPIIAAQAFADVAPRWRNDAAGLFNLVKTIGFSFGVTFVTLLVYRGTQENWSRLVGFLDPTRPGYSYFLQETGFDDASAETGALFVQIIQVQSSILTYTYAMEVLTLIALCGIPLTYFMRTKASQPETPVGSGVKTANAAAG
jgi:DHA2 family multidrug resistance protein